MLLKAQDPDDKKYKYFVDKCLPFGSSISCFHYQRFSNALKHLLLHKTNTKGKALTNYLDDFLFIAICKWMCDQMIQSFFDLCEELNVPVTTEKREWSSTLIVFLSILIDGLNFVLSLPLEKQQKALKLLDDMSGKCKAMVKDLQVLTGYLNFISRAIFLGRAFTRRIYTKYANLQTIKIAT